MIIEVQVTKRRCVIDGKIIEYYSYEAEVDGETIRFAPKPDDKKVLQLLLKSHNIEVEED